MIKYPYSNKMFDSIGKEVADLFADYNFSRSLKVSSENEAGTVVTATGDLLASGPRLKVEAGTKESSEWGSSDSSLASFVSLKNMSIDSEGKVSGELNMRTSNVTQLYINAEDERQEPGKPIKSFGTIGAKYSTPSFIMDTNVDIVNGPTSRSSCFYYNNHWNIKVGSEIQVNTHFDDNKDRDRDGNGPGVELENFNLGISFQGKSYTISARTYDRMGSISFGYFHQVSKKVTLGTMVNYGLTSNAQNLCMGTKIILDDANVVKLKINSGADLSGYLKHKLNSWASVDISAKVNLHQTIAANQKFGVGLTFDCGPEP